MQLIAYLEHREGMKSRIHPKYKARCRVANSREYEQGLVQRGDVTIWLSPCAIAAWKKKPNGRRGAQPKFSDLAIETALTLRLVFHLPIRRAEGFLRSLLGLMAVDLEVPDHTTLSRRSASLNASVTRQVGNGPIDLIIDSNGFAVVGDPARSVIADAAYDTKSIYDVARRQGCRATVREGQRHRATP